MWKYVVAFIVIFGLSVYVSWQTQRTADQGTQQTTQTSSGATASNAQDNHVQQDVKNPKRDTPFWFRFFTWHEGVTAWAILLTLLAIAEQTQQTRNAAEAGLDSANAARLNAQSLVNSERPWLIAEAVKNSQMPHFYEIQITNCGRTPARFISGDAAHNFVERPDLLPVPPIYSSPFTIPKQVLIATGKGFPIPHGYSIPHLLDIPEAANKTLIVYGRIIYEDTIIPNLTHETRWCFGYVPATREQITQPLPQALQALANEIQIPAHNMGGDFVLTGPNEYTKHT